MPFMAILVISPMPLQSVGEGEYFPLHGVGTRNHYDNKYPWSPCKDDVSTNTSQILDTMSLHCTL